MIEQSSARCCWCQGPLVRYEATTESTAAPWWCATRACQVQQAEWTAAQTIETPGRGRKKGTTRVRYLYVPTPRQVEWHRAAYQRDVTRLLVGGQAGPGKSRWMREQLYRFAQQVPGFHGLLLRRHRNDLEQSHLRFVDYEVTQRGGTYVPTRHVVTFHHADAPDAIIRMGHLDDSGALQNYLSSEYDVIAPDELVTFDRDEMLELFSRARTTNPAMRALRGNQEQKLDGSLVLTSTNPGGKGGHWVKSFFIDRTVDREDFPKYKPERWAFHAARLEDNPYIDEGYREALEQLPEMRRRQMLEGDWDAFTGQFFGEWRPVRDGAPWHVQDIALPKDTTWIGGLDWGFNAPGVMLWAAVLPDGALHIARELKFQQSPAEDVAKSIAKITEELGVKLRWIAADPAIWARTGSGRGETIAETLSRATLPMRKADNDRRQGWLRMHEWLRPMADQSRPWLTIAGDPHCAYLRRSLPSQIQDANDPDDVDTSKDDHACDAARYLLMSRPAPWRTNRVEAPPQGTLGAMLADLQRSTRAVLGTGQVRR